MNAVSRAIGYWAMVLFMFAAFGNNSVGGFASLTGGLAWYLCHDLMFNKPKKV